MGVFNLKKMANLLGIYLKVFLNSFLILYLELALIRFLPGYVYYLGYFANFVLIASFLGMGMGFLLARIRFSLIILLPIILLLLLGSARMFSFDIDTSSKEIVYFRGESGSLLLPPYVLLSVLFVVVAGAFTCLTQPLGRLFASSKHPLRLYMLDIIGSLLGILVFRMVVFFDLSAPVWFGIFSVFFVVFLFLLKFRVKLIVFAVIICIGIATACLDSDKIYWSPYYKITLLPEPKSSRVDLFANSIGHQFFSKLEDAPSYSLVYSRLVKIGRPLGDVLIIGSGTGQDVNAAIVFGAQHIDAVEIDPIILSIGKKYHPEKPYDNPKVTVFNNDGRDFLRVTDKKYDFIVFALTDSLVANSRLGQVRLESYIFTTEAFDIVRDRLKPGGYFVAYNDYREIWLVNRLRSMILKSFGKQPGEVNLGGATKVFFVKHEPDTPKVVVEGVFPTDDWPFFYRQEKTLTGFQLPILGNIFVISVLAIILGMKISSRQAKISVPRAGVFFLLGSAFALIEAKSIAQLALLFGWTWFVNVIAFSGILLVVLLALLWTLRFPLTRRLDLLFILLLVSLSVQFIFPVSNLMALSFYPRFIFSILYFYTPIFFANLIFANFFKKSETPSIDLGVNVIGLVFGTLVEYLAIVTGFSLLSIFAMILYVVAFVLLKLRKV